MTIRMYAHRKKMPLARVEVRLRHLQRASTGKDIRDIFERVIALTGELTSEQRQGLLEIAERYPVSKTLRQGSDISSSLATSEADTAS
jgi:putative redox protein